MATLASRGGEVHIRVGGNTQDYATLIDSLPQGNVIHKMAQETNNPTATPTLFFTRDLLYMMNNISHFVPVKWYLGRRPCPGSFYFPLTYVLSRRCSHQRYVKPAIAGCHRG